MKPINDPGSRPRRRGDRIRRARRVCGGDGSIDRQDHSVWHDQHVDHSVIAGGAALARHSKEEGLATLDKRAATPKLGGAEALNQVMQDYQKDMSSPLNAYPTMLGAFSVIGNGGQ